MREVRPSGARTSAGASSVAALLAGMLGAQSATANEALWAALRDSRAVALMRYVLAPSGGDPPGFGSRTARLGAASRTKGAPGRLVP